MRLAGSNGQAGAWSLDRINSPLRTLRELQQRPMWFYMTYISMYTGRRLTKPRDILAAFEGISWLLGQYMRAPSVFGLPTSHFDLALLWSPAQTVRRRRPKEPRPKKRTCTADAEGNCSCKSAHADTDMYGSRSFPSWSWSGWMDGRIEYDLDMVDGCLLDVNDWLSRRTWIQWYIRNEKGHLRPIWELLRRDVDWRQHSISVPEENATEDEARWRGYPVLQRDIGTVGNQGQQVHPTHRRRRSRKQPGEADGPDDSASSDSTGYISLDPNTAEPVQRRGHKGERPTTRGRAR